MDSKELCQEVPSLRKKAEISVRRTRKETSKSPRKRKSREKNEKDDEPKHSERDQPTGLEVHIPQFNLNETMAKAINQPSTTTTVEAVIEPTDYWYQHEGSYVSMPNLMNVSQSEAGKTFGAKSELTNCSISRSRSLCGINPKPGCNPKR